MSYCSFVIVLFVYCTLPLSLSLFHVTTILSIVKNTYVYLLYMYITPWNEYVKLSHLTHQDFCQHKILPLLITSVINISIINLHFHYDYG